MPVKQKYTSHSNKIIRLLFHTHLKSRVYVERTFHPRILQDQSVLRIGLISAVLALFIIHWRLAW
jgi:hypothetical protein